MGTLTNLARNRARACLITVWLGSALVSALELHGQSFALMQQTVLPVAWHLPVIAVGTTLDAALGLALWRWHSRRVYLAAGTVMAGMTLALTTLLPSLWLDPLGRLSKNLPVAALLLMLYEDAPA